MEQSPPSKKLLTIKEFAHQISVSVRKLYRMIDEGVIPKPLKQGNRSFLFEEDLTNYLSTLREQRK